MRLTLFWDGSTSKKVLTLEKKIAALLKLTVLF